MFGSTNSTVWETMAASPLFSSSAEFFFLGGGKKNQQKNKLMAEVTCLNTSAWVGEKKYVKSFYKEIKKWNAWIKCDIFTPAKNLNVRKQHEATCCELIAVLLPFVPKTWHFWALRGKADLRNRQFLGVGELFITSPKSKRRRTGGDMQAGNINLFCCF